MRNPPTTMLPAPPAVPYPLLALRAVLRAALPVLLLLATAGTASLLPAHAFEIVVNSDNLVPQIGTAELKRIYLGEQEFWRGGPSGPVQPVLREEGDTDFLRRLGVSQQQLTNRWMRLVFSGAAYPPHVARSDQEVLEYVASHPGSIGYVEQYSATPGVRTLPLTD
ncbi:MAG: hypothetical protein OEW11_09925 [Nitrospirota bacterium]|nr:hypothetical protein [Nitrospirota bacterium]